MTIWSTVRRGHLLPVVALAFSCLVSARGQCPSINFENLPAGTAVTTQYPGVTFSLSGTGCPAGTAFCRVIQPSGGTSSGSRALGRDQSCPDFYTGVYNMVFTEPQSTIRFRLGEWGGGLYTIRAYNAASGGTLLLTQTVGLGGDSLSAVYYPVTLAATGIRRVEITQSASGQTVIDDLEFPVDTTPPIASFSAPVEDSCFCSGGTIFGTADDPDGALSTWRLERRAFGASAWTLITTSSTPVISAELSDWFPASSAGEGYYVLRLTVTNTCGLVSTAERVVYLDRQFDSAEIHTPIASEVVGGTVCVDGTAWDHCPPSADVFSVAYAPLPAGAPFTTINPGSSGYDSTVINNPLVSWNTLSPPVADGAYRLRLTGATSCGFTSSVTRDIVVDNTPPIGFITSPHACDFVQGTVRVRGTATDANLGRWSLYYAGGPVTSWTLIATGTERVVNAALGDWHTAGLPRCAYSLRLVVSDLANVNCHAGTHTVEHVVTVMAGCEADYNGDGFVNSQDFFDFLTAFFAGCP